MKKNLSADDFVYLRVNRLALNCRKKGRFHATAFDHVQNSIKGHEQE